MLNSILQFLPACDASHWHSLPLCRDQVPPFCTVSPLSNSSKLLILFLIECRYNSSSYSVHSFHFSLVYTQDLVCAHVFGKYVTGKRGQMTFNRNSLVACATLAEYIVSQTANHFINTCVSMLNWCTYYFSSGITWTIWKFKL